MRADVIVVGSGVAGLSAALAAAPARVLLVTKTSFGASNSAWAQGGLAVALGPDDSPERHARDTVAVGVGLNDPDAVRVLTSAGPDRARRLLDLGARFDRTGAGGVALGREAAHSARRIVHAADATGAELVRTLTEAVRAEPSVTVVEHALVLDVLLDDAGAAVGVALCRASGPVEVWRTRAVVLATGGSGRLYAATTNPVEATADGQALAARAGAVLRDLEFVQFHPTALAAPGADPLPLVTEALRGEGATLVDETGRRFVLDAHPDGELAPRDVVARAVAAHRLAGHGAFLDARATVGDRFPQRFPTVFAACVAHGVDPRRDPIPVSPAAHYHMGGVATDLAGATSVRGLWAAGEVAATGVHGANRLASNSLLEGLVFGARAGAAAADATTAATGTTAAPAATAAAAATTATAGPSRRWRPPARPLAVAPVPVDDRAAVATLRRTMWAQVGLDRTADGLLRALVTLDGVDRERLGPQARNLVTVARLVTTAALVRSESRGAHHRRDHPGTDPAWARHLDLRLVDGEVVVRPGAGPLSEVAA